MIGPFDFCTTLSSGDKGATAGVGVEGELLFSAVCWGGCGVEQTANTEVAAAASAARPSSRRVSKVVAAVLAGAGSHFPQPDMLQLPQVLSELVMTFNEFSITLLLSRSVLLFCSCFKNRMGSHAERSEAW